MKSTIEKHILDNSKTYFMLLVVFILGLTIGITMINNLKIEQKEELKIYITDFINQMKENNKINYAKLFKSSLINNSKYIALIILLSFSIWNKIGVVTLVGYKGFSLGYSIAGVIAILGIGKGLLFTLPLILLSEVVYLPAVLFISVQSIKTYSTIITEDYNDNRVLIIKYAISLIIVIGITIISSLLQTYLNSNMFLLFTKYF